jgi:formylglycine-generating enzyme required for sulfatase activity
MTPFPTRLTFRRLAGGTLTLGTVSGALGDVAEDGNSDEATRVVTVAGFHCGILEVTQGQWKLISGTDPWVTDPSPTLGGVTARGNDLPAFGLSLSAIQSGLAAFNARSATKLRLLTNDEWEYACRGDSQGQFSWGRTTGDDLNPVTVAQFAAVRESVAGVRGPQSTGRFRPDGQYRFHRLANAFGLYDMHGNVWEWVSDGGTVDGNVIRGGSWSDSLVSARVANRQYVPATVPYGLAGIRLAIQP